MANQEKVPLWSNQGTKPPEKLLQEGYRELDTPDSGHFNYLLNKVTSGLSEVQEGFIDKRGDLLESGIPTLFSEQRLTVLPSATLTGGITEHLVGSYLATVTYSDTSGIAFSIGSKKWGADMLPFGKSATFSLTFLVSSTKSSWVGTTTPPELFFSSSSATIVNSTFIDGAFTSGADTVVSRMYQIVFTVAPGTTEMFIDVTPRNATNGTSTATLNISQLATTYGKFFSGKTLSYESLRAMSKSGSFKNDTTTTLTGADLIAIPTADTKVGSVSVSTTAKVGTIPANANGTLLTLSNGMTGNGMYTRLLIVGAETATVPPKLFISNYDVTKTGTTPRFEEIVTAKILEDKLSTLVTEDSLPSILAPYTKKTDLTLYLTKEETATWQKSKYTADDGSELFNFTAMSASDAKIAISQIRHKSIATIALPNSIIPAGSVKYGDKTVALIGAVRGTISLASVNTYVLDLWGVGEANNVYVPYNYRIVSEQGRPDFWSAEQLWDSQTDAASFSTSFTNSLASIKSDSSDAFYGTPIYSGRASAVNEVLQLRGTIAKYTHLNITVATSSFPGVLITVPLSTYRNGGGTVSLEVFNVLDDVSGASAYELLLKSDDGYTGDKLSIGHNNRFNLVTKAGTANGGFIIITEIRGIIVPD